VQGRGQHPARVILQTYSPGHYAVRHAVGHDYLGFAHEEIRIRRAAGFPRTAASASAPVPTATTRRRRGGRVGRRKKLSATLTPDLGVDVLGPTPRLSAPSSWRVPLADHGAGGASLEGALPHLPTGAGLEHRRRSRPLRFSVALLEIITRDNPRLRLKARRVPKVDDSVRRLMDDRWTPCWTRPGSASPRPR